MTWSHDLTFELQYKKSGTGFSPEKPAPDFSIYSAEPTTAVKNTSKCERERDKRE